MIAPANDRPTPQVRPAPNAPQASVQSVKLSETSNEDPHADATVVARDGAVNEYAIIPLAPEDRGAGQEGVAQGPGGPPRGLDQRPRAPRGRGRGGGRGGAGGETLVSLSAALGFGIPIDLGYPNRFSWSKLVQSVWSIETDSIY